MTTPTYQKLNDLLVERIPETRAAIQELRALYHGEVDPFMAFQFGLMPWLTSLMRQRVPDKDALKRAFDVIEFIADGADDRARSVVVVEVIDPLISRRGLKLSEPPDPMGPATRVLFIERMRFWETARARSIGHRIRTAVRKLGLRLESDETK